jgi:radical SAM protein with 4Fe4S-binding SPASM domain
MTLDLRAREDGDRTPQRLSARRDQRREFLREKMTEGAEPGLMRADRGVCKACSLVHVEPNGELRPCALLDVPLGNARDGNVAETLETHPAARLLRSLKWSDLPGCNVCEIGSLCQRCHAQSLQEVGDALRPYPGACTNAILKWEIATGRQAPAGMAEPEVVGPFRITDEGSIEPFEARLSQAQERMYREHRWLRRSAAGAEAPVEAGQLVQLRRPGRKAGPERVPSAASSEKPPAPAETSG